MEGFQARMEQLRGLMYQAPSQEAWEELVLLLGSWPVEQDLGIAVEYAATNLEGWPDALRVMPPSWWARVQRGEPFEVWRLVRAVGDPAQAEESRKGLGALLTSDKPDAQARVLALVRRMGREAYEELGRSVSVVQVQARAWLREEGPELQSADLKVSAGRGALTQGLFEALMEGPGPWRAAEALTLAARPELVSLAPLRRLERLWFLRAQGCDGLRDVEGLEDAPSLAYVSLLSNGGLRDARALERVRGLRWLELGGPLDVSWVGRLTGLEGLNLTGARGLKSVEALRTLGGLRSLVLGPGLGEWRDLSPLAQLRGLRRLDVTGPFVSDLSPLEGLEELRGLRLAQLRGLDDPRAWATLGRLPRLEALTVEGGTVERLSGLEGCRALRSLSLRECGALLEVSALGGLPRLEEVNLSGASSLTSLRGLERCPALRRVVAKHCPSLRDASLRGVEVVRA